MLNDLVIDLGGHVDRQGEADAVVSTGFGGDHRIDPNYFTVTIEQRATGVTGVNGGIGLNEALEHLRTVDVAALGADDADGDGSLKAKGGTDGDGPIADLDAVGVGDADGLERLTGGDFEDRDVGLFVGADHPGFVLGLLIGELHIDVVSFVDNVIVGHDVTRTVDHEAGAGALALGRRLHGPAPAGRAFATLAKEAAEHVHLVLVTLFGIRSGGVSRHAALVDGRGGLGRVVRANVYH